MKIISTAERQLAKQLYEEQQERNRSVTALWARLEEVDQQIQVLQAQSQERQMQALAPSTLHAPVQDSNIALLQRNLEAATTVSENTEVNSQVSRLEERVQTLMDQISEGQSRFSNGSSDMASVMQSRSMVASSSTGSCLERLPANTNGSMATLQTSLKDLDAKHGQLVKELSYVKGVLTEVHISMHINAIRASRIALQSTDLSREERSQALAALDKKEVECKGHIRKVCTGPHLADLMAALTTGPIS